MVGEEDVLFRPVLHNPPMYSAERLLDCTIDLQFVMLCNEAIDVQQENERRAHAAAKQGG